MIVVEFAVDVVAFMVGLAIYDWLKTRGGGGRCVVCETTDFDPRLDGPNASDLDDAGHIPE